MERRIFLQSIAVLSFQATIAATLSGCGRSRDSVALPALGASFPQGVASADPTTHSVVLWTRALPQQADLDAFTLYLEVSDDEAFASLMLREVVEARAAQDFTVHARVIGLEADRVYYYRFVSGLGDLSVTGRTWTAPEADALQTVKLAFVSCQERKHGFYGAWRRMLLDDLALPPTEQIRFVLYLGDFIYETDESWQDPLDAFKQPIPGGLLDVSGAPRDLGRFPDGGVSASGIHHARTLADYRHLYRRYLTDPDLMAARARWPFVCIWDDHEFSDDCWQSEANYDDEGANASTNEPSQQRKVAANQAWSEYIPVDYQADETGSPHHAHAFRFADVANVPNDKPNDDNSAAIESLVIYRRLRFGKILDLVLTDNRSWRSDHAVPEDISGRGGVFIHPRAVMPLEVLNTLDAGREANDGRPPAFLGVGGMVFENPRRHSPPGSILGAQQKAWWKAVMSESQSRWRLWGNSVPLMRFKVELSKLNTLLPDIVLSSDSWDGYAHERRELMRYLLTQQIQNVVSLSGDVHAHFSGLVMDDYDVAQPQSAMVEVVTAAISSLSMFSAVEQLSRRQSPNATEAAVRSLITYPDSADPRRLVVNLDNTLLNGVDAGLAAAEGRAATEVASLRDETVNAHLRFADTDAHGYGTATVAADAMTVQLVTMETIVDREQLDQVKSVAEFVIPYTDEGDAPVILKT